MTSEKVKHGNTGNNNAGGELPADAQLQCRVPIQFKNEWVKAAQAEGLKLTPWVIKTLNAAVD
jgi:predicted HicB family RNase H-like nuclease